jgi:uncharacterized membrane protein
VNLPDVMFTPNVLVLGTIAFAGVLWAALRSSPWTWLAADGRQHAFAGAIVVCMLLWSISAKLGGGPSFHLLGATTLTLMFGPALAFIAAALALTGATLAGMAGWGAFGVNALIMGAVPIATSYALYRLVDARVPNHFFVYVLLSAFVNGGVAMMASRMSTMAVLWLNAGTGGVVAVSDYVLSSVLLAWGEALTTGMLMTLFVVYRPDWVRLFDDERYLMGR